MNESVKQGEFPKKIRLPDGSEVELRVMTAGDRDAILQFANGLSEADLMFLRVDLTEPKVVDEWVANLQSGLSSSILAYDAEGLIGYATVHRTPARWTRRVGEIRVNVSPQYRTRGLGRSLISEIFDVARGLGLRKLMANMVADQRGARTAFQRLGFVVEALLADFVEDRAGATRDLVVMSYDIDGHSEQVDQRVRI
ncbi:MAG: GNAT family protein [Pseudomonadales bacterium]|nr:GNAT family N-acetyltransferase [Pseudomonadales bacterium]